MNSVELPQPHSPCECRSGRRKPRADCASRPLRGRFDRRAGGGGRRGGRGARGGWRLGAMLLRMLLRSRPRHLQLLRRLPALPMHPGSRGLDRTSSNAWARPALTGKLKHEGISARPSLF